MVKKLTKNGIKVEFAANSTLDENVNLVFGPELLSLNLDLGRQDLNENFKKVEDKINELIRKQ